MGLFVVKAIRRDAAGEIESVQWARVDGVANEHENQFNVVEVDRVVEAIDRGDRVEFVLSTANGDVSGGYLMRKVLPGGFENVQEENPIENCTLRDMPIF